MYRKIKQPKQNSIKTAKPQARDQEKKGTENNFKNNFKNQEEPLDQFRRQRTGALVPRGRVRQTSPTGFSITFSQVRMEPMSFFFWSLLTAHKHSLILPGPTPGKLKPTKVGGSN